MAQSSIENAAQDLIVPAACEAMSTYFTTTIQALGQDVQTLLAKNPLPPPASEVIAKFTAAMIAELGIRVTATLP